MPRMLHSLNVYYVCVYICYRRTLFEYFYFFVMATSENVIILLFPVQSFPSQITRLHVFIVKLKMCRCVIPYM